MGSSYRAVSYLIDLAGVWSLGLLRRWHCFQLYCALSAMVDQASFGSQSVPEYTCPYPWHPKSCEL